MQEKLISDKAAHTQSFPLPRPSTTFLPLPGATTPPLNLTSLTQRELGPSNAHDLKERVEPRSTLHPPAHLLVAQELEALHMREEREMPPVRSMSFKSANHRVLRPHPISPPWLPHPTLYPEWGTYSAPGHPSPPPLPPPPALPSPYSFHTISDDREVASQTHVHSWYPGAWCLRCRLQEAYVHTRSFGDAVTHINHLPALPSTSTTAFPIATNKPSVFCGSRFVLDKRATETFTSYK